MCGIAGFTNLQESILRDPAASAERMAEAMRLRGPDDHGVWISENRRLALSHWRLSNLLKSAFGDFLPPEVLTRKKYGFGIPVGEWLRSDLKGLFESVVSRKNVEQVGFLNYDVVRGIFLSHLSERRDATPLLWSIFAFQWWANRNL